MRILLMDENQPMRRLLCELLTEEGFSVCEVRERDLDIVSLSSRSADAAVLGILPGNVFCRELLTRLGGSPEIPVIVLLSQDNVGERVDYLRLGADDVLIKPFDAAELAAKLRNVIRRGSGQKTAAGSAVCGISVDPYSYTVRVGERALALPPKETEILRLFLANPQRVYSRGEIAALVWRREVADRTVDAHISRLKALLGRPYSDRIISVRGVGYKMEPR